MLTAWARNWWTLIVRGVAAIIFGLITFMNPRISLVALIGVFAAYAFVDGIFNIVGAVRGAQASQRWGLLFVEGLVSIAAGIATLFWPVITAMVLLYLIAAWALVTGVLEIGAAVRLRHEIEHEWLLALAGVASIAFGVLLMMHPMTGALAVVLWIGAYAIFFGVLEIGLGIRVHSWANRLTGTTPQTPVPA